MPIFTRRSRPTVPTTLLAGVDEEVLGAVPLAEDDSSWAVATAGRLIILSQAAPATAHPWTGVERASWEAETRTFTVTWTDEAADPLILRVVAGVRRHGEFVSWDVAPFARALRQRVEAAIVHAVTATLPSGLPASASVRRAEDSSLYIVTRPASGQGEADEAALRALRRRAADGVGLPTD
ncbi:hypothetical protein ACSL103130_04535 [Actinomyces slackii]|uniref:Uncharacterized protein n=1 Tax=Actinomyces slackii TaxID=52774 RepID=A0A448KET4_9ACTO|nr:hypothetical protein [Actinomyces slackii]VEG75412.1 Uncharacterised protein [Actinomyces slackii]